MFFSNDNTVAVMYCLAASMSAAEVLVTCTGGYANVDLHYCALITVTADLLIDFPFPNRLQSIGLLFLTFSFFLGGGLILSKHLPAQ